MDNIQCVSLPRSGHNLLVKHLQDYFQSHDACSPVEKTPLPFVSKAKTRQFQTSESERNAFHYCEYYYACRSHPCRDGRNTFQKSHDFELLLPVQQQQKYIVQKRNPLDLLISWFEMRLLKGREVNSAPGFNAFVKRNQPYLDSFHKKWTDAPIRKRLVFDYDSYLARPIESLQLAIHFFDEAHEFDTSRLKEVVRDVRPAKDNRNFRFIESVPRHMYNGIPSVI